MINTVRLKNDDNVIKTKTDVPFRLNISKMICGIYAKVLEIYHYKLTSVINFEGSKQAVISSGHFTAHILVSMTILELN